MKLSEEVQVLDRMGLHTRLATEIVKLLQYYKSCVNLTYKKLTINARSILGILMLAARYRAKIRVTVDGEDAQEVLSKMKVVLSGG